MKSITPKPIYDPAKTFDDNFDNGPFGGYSEADTFVNNGEPEFSFLGHPIYSPFGIPAGPLPNSKYVIAAMNKGFDVVCYKTQRSDKFGCNEFPNVLFLDIDGDLTLEKAKIPQLGLPVSDKPITDYTITNSFGNPSRGPEFWVNDLAKAVSRQGKGQLIIMSVVGTIKPGFTDSDYFDDFAATAKLAVGAGVKAIELNLSCPNVASEGVLCYTPDSVKEICERTKAAVGNIPIIAKLGYFSSEQQELLETVINLMSPFVGAISSINTISAPIVDADGNQALPGPNRLNSGVCGAGIKWAGLDMVKRLSELRKKLSLTYEIIGVGGVMTTEDFQQYRTAGADVVQSATGSMWNVNLATEIKQS
jgi:dihydroorotate dehydrogenase (NAD+) catalytic subunit